MTEPRKFNYQKPKENVLTIDSNEVKKEFKPVRETYTDYIKPCSLVDEHIKNCTVCKNKLLETHAPVQPTPLISQKYIENAKDTIEAYSNFDLNESFENISPSQKNLVIVVLYGILIILISDLIIKDKK